MREKSDWEQGYDQAQRRFYEERKVLTARIAELEADITRLLTESDDAHMAEARYIAKDELAKKDTRIAELEKDLSNKEIEYTDLWDDALALQSRIAELEALVEQLIWVGNDLIDDNNNPVTITLFDGLVVRSQEREDGRNEQRKSFPPVMGSGDGLGW